MSIEDHGSNMMAERKRSSIKITHQDEKYQSRGAQICIAKAAGTNQNEPVDNPERAEK